MTPPLQGELGLRDGRGRYQVVFIDVDGCGNVFSLIKKAILSLVGPLSDVMRPLTALSNFCLSQLLLILHLETCIHCQRTLGTLLFFNLPVQFISLVCSPAVVIFRRQSRRGFVDAVAEN